MWTKKGLLFKTDNYASIPCAFHLKDNLYRIYYSSRNPKNQTQPYYIDSIIDNGEIKLIGTASTNPILDLGNIGTFDDSGIMPSSIIRNNDEVWMYYIGWNPQITVSYRLSIGLAISRDGGATFKKYSEGPLLDRSLSEPYFNTAPFVLKDNNIWKMWYISCTGWVMDNGKTEPIYNVKYCESSNGIDWVKNNITCIDYTDQIECIGRPYVLKHGETYEMYFSNRKKINYRNDKNSSYKISNAVSKDGIHWSDYQMDILEYGEDWDQEMREYCCVFKHKNYIYMIYNGNNFGKEGFGYAIKNINQ